MYDMLPFCSKLLTYDIESLSGDFSVITNASPYEALSEVEILEKLEKSRESAKQGMYYDASEVSNNMRTKYGL